MKDMLEQETENVSTLTKHFREYDTGRVHAEHVKAMSLEAKGSNQSVKMLGEDDCKLRHGFDSNPGEWCYTECCLAHNAAGDGGGCYGDDDQHDCYGDDDQ